MNSSFLGKPGQDLLLAGRRNQFKSPSVEVAQGGATKRGGEHEDSLTLRKRRDRLRTGGRYEYKYFNNMHVGSRDDGQMRRRCGGKERSTETPSCPTSQLESASSCHRSRRLCRSCRNHLRRQNTLLRRSSSGLHVDLKQQTSRPSSPPPKPRFPPCPVWLRPPRPPNPPALPPAAV